mmetsp:Transcript_19464/g.22265  ORF Transcript_19464/g.22265 Transcript_19464/m.22265 type:complete len:374 (-) Transcript_19464:311-1432(-)
MYFSEVLCFFILPTLIRGWGNNNNDDTDYTKYSDSISRDWLNDGSYVSLKLEGCVWGYVYDSEEAGCLEDSSEDGTYSWYQMSNCRRAQAAFSLYASSSAGSCSSGNFQESFVTTVGVSEFINWMTEYDEYSPFLSDDDDTYNDDANDNDWDWDDLPICEEGEYGYIGLGCNDDGTFSLNYYEDAYCLYKSAVYDTLDQLNYKLQTYSNCQGLTYLGADNDDADDEDKDDEVAGLAQNLMYYSTSCSNADSSLCTDDASMQNRMSGTSSSSSGIFHTSTSVPQSWTTKIKYGSGGVLLLASLIMFTGILFTNRRRRKALMQRKFRQSRSDRSRRSKSRSGKSRRSKSSRRSRSKSRAREREKERERDKKRDGN